ncbi:MAG: FAD-binding oxidoreductase, partial [Actinomycetota bacterium]|nr:FAD-binding oxidoreductase [Actinomycetota bacterium]
TKAVGAAPARGAVPRGLGRAYGDAAQNAGGLVVETVGVSGLLGFDERTGEARLAAGTSFDEIMRTFVPKGWFVPVTPGTRFVTVGGAIAADIHGKNHHADGTLGQHVRSMELALVDGTTRTLTADGTPDEFWATCGGVGLTGTILEATIALQPIETSRVAVDTDRFTDFDDLLTRLRDGRNRHRYSVAWIDPMARGRHLGRSVLTQGDFAPRAALAPGDDPLAFHPRTTLTVPHAPSGLINRASVRAFNELRFRKAPARRRDELQSISTFFHPLDLASSWNRIYGRRGFLQWQCLVPFGAEDVLRQCLEALGSHGAPSFLAVLKTMGAAAPGPLSFPAPGWTLALDVPAGSLELAAVLDRLDDLVVGAGGRQYLAKDSRLRPELLPAMYPRLDEWRAVRDRLDPERRLNSDLARRLDLLG